MAARFEELGVRGESQVVVYDEVNGSFAARAWWLLRWLGHARAAVLDGGMKAWRAAGGAIESGGAIGPDAGPRPGEPARPAPAPRSRPARGGRLRGAGRLLEGGAPAPGGCPRARALRRHGRAHRRGRGHMSRARSTIRSAPTCATTGVSCRRHELERRWRERLNGVVPGRYGRHVRLGGHGLSQSARHGDRRAFRAPGSTQARGANGFAIPAHARRPRVKLVIYMQPQFVMVRAHEHTREDASRQSRLEDRGVARSVSGRGLG